MRRVILDTFNLAYRAEHSRAAAGPCQKFNICVVSLCLDRVLAVYVQLLLEPQLYERLTGEQKVKLHQVLLSITAKCEEESNVIKDSVNSLSDSAASNNSTVVNKELQKLRDEVRQPGVLMNWHKIHELWAAAPQLLPPIVVFYEMQQASSLTEKLQNSLNEQLDPKIRQLIKQQLRQCNATFKELKDFKFTEFLHLPIGKCYGDRMLLDYAAKSDAVVISNDQFKDFKSDPLATQGQRRVVGNSVLNFCVDQYSTYFYLPTEKLLKLLRQQPGTQN